MRSLFGGLQEVERVEAGRCGSGESVEHEQLEGAAALHASLFALCTDRGQGRYAIEQLLPGPAEANR